VCSVLDYQSRGRRLISPPRYRDLCQDFCAMMSTPTVNCRWEDETVIERTDHPPSYAEAKKMKSLALHTHGCLKSLVDCSSSSVYISRVFSPAYRRHRHCFVSKEVVHIAGNCNATYFTQLSDLTRGGKTILQKTNLLCGLVIRNLKTFKAPLKSQAH